MKTFVFIILTSLFVLPVRGQTQNDILSIPTFDKDDPPKKTGSTFSPMKKMVSLSDSTFLISGRVLMNLDADGYKLTLSLIQQADSVIKCNEMIDRRINQFTSDLKQLNIYEDDIYIDNITQYPVYDYDIERKSAVQEKVGYEINKNMIIRFDSLALLSPILNLAAENEIHDAVKLDYILNDVGKIYEQLFSEALAVIEKKKDLYLKATNLKIEDQAVIFSEQFQFVFPDQLYKAYQAYESSNIEFNSYRSKRFIEEQRKKTTRFYDAINFSGFDRYINPEKISIGLQAVFEIQIKYERVKG